jgi:hypothetical protein
VVEAEETKEEEVMRLRRGTWASYMCLGVATFLFLTLLPFVILGEWEHARRISVPLVALFLGWILRKSHDEEKQRRKLS